MTLSDFVALPTLLQIAVAIVAIVMSLRGLHLAGDRRFIKLWAWLALGAAISSGAIAVLAHRDSRLAAGDMKAVRDAIKGLRSSLSVPPNASYVAVIAAAMTELHTQEVTIGLMKKQIAGTAAGVQSLLNPPQNPDKAYQAGAPVGTVSDAHVAPDHRTFVFDLIEGASEIDFALPIRFRQYDLQCGEPDSIDSSSAVGPGMPSGKIYKDIHCAVITDAE